MAAAFVFACLSAGVFAGLQAFDLQFAKVLAQVADTALVLFGSARRYVASCHQGEIALAAFGDVGTHRKGVALADNPFVKGEGL